MKKLVILISLASLFAIIACGGGNKYRRDATTVGEEGWVFEGWACAPNAALAKKGISPSEYCDDTPINKHDYLYMKFSAVASDKAINSGRLAAMMSTCREAARVQIAGDGMTKILGEYLEKASGVSDGQSTGVAILSQAQGRISGMGVYDCCAIDNDTGSCVKPGEKENWEQCMCVGFMRFKGGQKAFDSRAEAARSQ